TAVTVVNPKNGIEIAEQVLPGQEFIDVAANDWGTPQAAPDGNPEAQFACAVMNRFQADVVHFNSGAIAGSTVHGNLELARQEGEFRVKGRPLANDFAPGARVDHLILGDTGKLVGSGVTNAVAAGLDRMHLHGGQLGQDIRHIFQFRPVELYVGARTDVGVALVVLTGNFRQLANLLGGHQSIRYGHAQHGRIALNVQAILKTQWQKLGITELTGQIAANLIAELTYPIFD